MDVRVGLWRRLSTEELMLLNCGVGEDSWESLDCKKIQPVHSEGDQPWDFFGRNDAKAEISVLWPSHVKSWVIGKDSDAGRDWGQEEKGTTEDEMAGWRHRLDGWMASPTWWMWVWVNSVSWWWTGRPGVLRFMGSQRVGHDWATDLIWSDPIRLCRFQMNNIVFLFLKNLQPAHSKNLVFIPSIPIQFFPLYLFPTTPPPHSPQPLTLW